METAPAQSVDTSTAGCSRSTAPRRGPTRYLPFFLYPAESRVPGWKGAEIIWRWMDYGETCPSYFGEFEVHGTSHVDPDAQYVVASHPHGTVIFQRTYWRTPRFEALFRRDWRFLAASVLFKIPVVRELSLFFGALAADKATAERVLEEGKTLIVYPGGLDEANSLGVGSGDVRIKPRTGFVRLAVAHGTPVLVTFAFGELDAVEAVALLPHALTTWVRRKFRMSTTFFAGRWYTPVPKRVPFNMVFAPPIPVTQLAPSDPGFDAEVARVYDAYTAAVVALYDENHVRFGYSGRPLVFV